MRRLREAIITLDRSSTAQQKRVFWLTVAIGALTVVSVAASGIQAWAILSR